MKPSLINTAVILALAMPALSFADTAAMTPEQQQAIAQELSQLKQMRQQLDEQAKAFEKRIAALEQQVNAEGGQSTLMTSSASTAAATTEVTAAASPATQSSAPASDAMSASSEQQWGKFEPGKGFVLARTDMGEMDFSAFTYARYLNQLALDESYTNSFGKTSDLDLRNDIQFQKLTLNFKGWLFDPKFRYLFYTWTSNTSQGDGAQVVVAGNLGYQFNEAFNLYAGIGALPSTRSTNYTFPNWLKNDHRTIADEYFRGSYTTGIWANGKIAPGLEYRVMLGNNLSQLGVNAAQLDDGLNTVSGALWWMPTTGEYGPGQGFGDYEYHDKFATQFGVHFTHSREDAQGQSDTEGFENSQLRLSDGTLIFSSDPFGTGGDIRKATYAMMALNGGFKYQGWSLEGEFYRRVIDDFQTTGAVPISSQTDTGFQLQGSTMLLKDELQAYAAYSKIYGDYGNPSDLSLGINWFPLARRELRLNLQGLYLDDSPVGYSSVPFAVGGNGWVFSSDLILAF